MARWLLIAACLLVISPAPSFAGIKTKAAKEAAEYITKKFSKEAAEQGVETLARKIETLAAKYGDDAIVAARKVGPRAIHLVEEAGENGAQVVKLMARYGDDAVWVVTKKNRMAIFLKYGDDAAEAMIKQGEIAEPLIESIGSPAVGALKTISTRNGRRLAMLADDGTLANISRTDELLGVVSRYGDKAMDFIWRNKGSLTVAAALTAFLRDPKPFIDGTKDLTTIVAENVAKPIASVPGQVAVEAAKGTNWTIVVVALIVAVGGLVGGKLWLKSRAVKAALDRDGLARSARNDPGG